MVRTRSSPAGLVDVAGTFSTIGKPAVRAPRRPVRPFGRQRLLTVSQIGAVGGQQCTLSSQHTASTSGQHAQEKHWLAKLSWQQQVEPAWQVTYGLHCTGGAGPGGGGPGGPACGALSMARDQHMHERHACAVADVAAAAAGFARMGTKGV